MHGGRALPALPWQGLHRCIERLRWLSTLIRNYGDVLRCRNLRALVRRFLSLARSACRSRRVKVHLNGLAARW